MPVSTIDNVCFEGFDRRLMITLTFLAALNLSALHSALAQSTDNNTIARNPLFGGALIGGTVLTFDALKHKHHKHHHQDQPPMIPLAPGVVIFRHQINLPSGTVLRQIGEGHFDHQGYLSIIRTSGSEPQKDTGGRVACPP